VDSVGGNEHLTFDCGARLPADGVCEARDDTSVRYVPLLEMVAGVDAVCAEPRAGLLQQEHLQVPAMDRDLRPAIAGRAPARLAPDSLSVLREIYELGGGDPDPLEL